MAENDYRWIVTVKRTDRLASVSVSYSREVETDGPKPEVAVEKALKRITDGDNDLWQANTLTITVERVR